MAELSNYTETDLEARAIEQLGVYVNRRGTPPGDRAADAAADAMWELRTRARLGSGEVDINGMSTAYRAQASRIYATVASAALGRPWMSTHDRISAAIQRRMRVRREAWMKEQS